MHMTTFWWIVDAAVLVIGLLLMRWSARELWFSFAEDLREALEAPGFVREYEPPKPTMFDVGYALGQGWAQLFENMRQLNEGITYGFQEGLRQAPLEVKALAHQPDYDGEGGPYTVG